MNYLLLLIIILLCGGGYYEYNLQDQRIKDDEQKFSDQEAKLTALQAEKDKLSKDNSDLTASLADAKKKIADAGQAAVTAPTTAANAAPAAPGNPAAGLPPSAPSVPTKATADQMSQAVVVIKGDNAEGTGFLVKTAEGPAVVTNLHVLANNPHLKILTSSGVTIVTTGMKGASDRDLAMLPIQDGPYSYLPMATDVSRTAQAGDEVITPGNSQGGNVVLNTKGAMLAMGPDRVEFNNPIYHGNSGGPVFHTKSGTVIGVVTEAMKVDVSNDLDKTSFASRNSAIASSIRYFGLRLDTVPKWEPYDPRQYQNETAFLDEFEKQSQRLDSYLNSKQNGNSPQTGSDNAQLYETDDKIMGASRAFHEQLNGTDTGAQIEALRQLGFTLDGIADKNVVTLQNTNNFYSFDQLRARDELAYRKALKVEIQKFASDVNHIADLPRTNN
jgi:S1-C subfamily serine protease